MPPRAIRAALNDAESLPAALEILRAYYGSHDKFAAELGNTRQRTIAWSQGKSHPDDVYQDKLEALGVPRRLLTPPATVEEVWKIQRRVEAEVVRVRRLLEAIGPEPS